MATHQGRVLKELIKKEGLTQEEAARMFNYSRAGFRLLFKEEKLKKDIIEKASELFHVEKDVFFPKEEIALTGHSSYNRPTQNGGAGNVQVIGTYNECVQELLALQKDLIAEKEKSNQLQQQIIEMLKEQKK